MDASELIDSIYGRFVLRDVLGKMVPGFIPIATGAYTIIPPNQMLSIIEKLSIWAWLAIAGLSWLLAFASS